MKRLLLRRGSSGVRAQAGLTLVELLVAIVLGLLVTGAAIATLLVARRGFTTVDAGSQLRETARFAANQIERVVVESGFENTAYGYASSPKDPGLRGYDNSLVAPAFSSLPNGLAHGTRSAGSNCGSATGTACANGSDVLVVRFLGVSRSGVADGSMVNCGGVAEPEGSGGDPRAYSIFHVATGAAGEVDAEPALACTYRDPVAGTFRTVSVVQGVESFQVLYGAYGVTPGACAAAPSGNDPGPESYLTAAELDGSGGSYCPGNWMRVRSLRIGLLVRGPVNTAPLRAAKTWNLLGRDNSTGFVSTTRDPGSQLTTAGDGRLRQQFVFTVHLRNLQHTP